MIYYTNLYSKIKENDSCFLNLIKNYNYYQLSKNLNITEEFILKQPYQYWYIRYLIKNN